MSRRLHIRNVILVLIGVAGLLSKTWFRDSMSELAYSYLGNLTVSFAVYFLAAMAVRGRLNRFVTAALALAVVESYEFTDGFGIMTNVYDPYDYLANALGIALAGLVDVVSAPAIQRVR